MLRYSNVSNTQ